MRGWQAQLSEMKTIYSLEEHTDYTDVTIINVQKQGIKWSHGALHCSSWRITKRYKIWWRNEAGESI